LSRRYISTTLIRADSGGGVLVVEMSAVVETALVETAAVASEVVETANEANGGPSAVEASCITVRETLPVGRCNG
jgi:hypothetical protein